VEGLDKTNKIKILKIKKTKYRMWKGWTGQDQVLSLSFSLSRD